MLKTAKNNNRDGLRITGNEMSITKNRLKKELYDNAYCILYMII